MAVCRYPGAVTPPAGAAAGPLATGAGLATAVWRANAVKDNIDVAGWPIGSGSCYAGEIIQRVFGKDMAKDSVHGLVAI
ncbi:amidase (partial) [Erwinia amylovora Ea644]|uniref:hypothetical protein n=1 Tax=Erwinia amylovora TaxID=552 RepID=UPI0002CCA5BF|nr:hypothetical protein [Erwinia amylovora]CCP04237.1 amidase (partial) [Erwinia amylovora Ea644]CCP08307.1 amidase (partial) [Erwinia amylovora MR1]